MYRLKSIIFYVITTLLFCDTALAQMPTPTTVIYLLDVSGSMKSGGLFKNIQGRLKELVGERKVGDTVVLGTFSDDVFWPLKVEIHSIDDINDIKRVIDNLKAEGPWTWMSKAFKETKEKAQEIRAKSPESGLIVYILTDCKNDPPPHIKTVEPPWGFVEVILKYFEGFEAKGAYVYLFSYRTLDPEEKKEIEEKTPLVVKEPKEVAHPMPQIKLSFSGFDFGEIDLFKGKITRSGEISVDDFQDVETGEKVQLISPAGFDVKPEFITCKEKGQKESVAITIPSNLQPGEHTEIIKLQSEKATVEPPKLKFSFLVTKIETPHIKLSFSGFDFGEIDLFKGKITRSGEISVDDFQDVETGEKVQLISPAGFDVKPEFITCKEKGQKESVAITIPSNLQPGEHTEIIKLQSEKATVEPPKLKFSFLVTKIENGKISKLFKMILPLIILALLFILYDALIKTKTIWIEKIGDDKTKDVQLRGWKKVYLGEKLVEKYITFGLSKHYIRRARLQNTIFLIEEGGGKRAIIPGQDVQCKDVDGDESTLRFYEEEPMKRSPAGNEELHENGSDIFNRIEGKDE